MNELLKRILTAIIFGALVIGSLLFHPISFAIVLTIFIVFASFEWINITRHLGHSLTPLLFIFFSVWFFLPAVFLSAEMELLTGLGILSLLLILPAAGIIEMFRNKEHAVLNLMILGSGLMYIVAPMGILILLTQNNFLLLWHEFHTLPLFLFIVIWTYDTFAYFTGSLFGKHKLFERLSPKKTWEGAIGGTIITMILMYFVLPLFIALPIDFIVIGSILIIIAATFGDLFESMLKRKAGVKDSGSIFPGHGGVLDRFDSVFFAAPVFFIFWVIYSFLVF
jgi:phosphatidate cytidylyltransferase